MNILPSILQKLQIGVQCFQSLIGLYTEYAHLLLY